ncbi:ABC transporter ATP-binding protein [Lunatimonas salinarum]|uniref:ABC transporter ATP-binding protein n=1 Tax=Lunatimonas salinarum TaxID=1774590 RepID=UPI001ADF25A9|nr:ABC transporter ATP-binding protein [Lunatimonas salinarum]
MSFFCLRGISKRFDKDTQALSGITLELAKGQLLGLIGESGSGKSTFLRIAAGLETQDRGEVLLDGEPILNPSQKLVAGYDQIQLVHQQFKLYPNSTVEENIRRPLLLYDKSYAQERTEYLLDAFNLESMRRRLPRELSGGQQQKVAIAKALSSEPEVLLFDEPFSHLDSLQKRQLLLEIQAVFRKLHVTGIWVTHDISDALMLTPYIAVLRKGTLIQQGNVEELFNHPKNRYVASLFTPINPLPEGRGRFLRPTAIRVSTDGEGLAGRITSCCFLPYHNQLTVCLTGTGLEWIILDERRIFRQGDLVSLVFPRGEIMTLSE